MNPAELKQHPLGKIIPPMSDEDYRALVEDIKAHGFSVSHPIVIHEEMILDGLHRHMASIDAGVRPEYIHFIAPDMADSPRLFVLQENLNRRHLSASQRAAIAAELMEAELEEPEAVSSPISDATPRSSTDTTEKAARSAGVSRSVMADAKAVLKSDPEAHQQVKKGEISVSAAKKASDAKGEAFRTAAGIIEKTLGKGWVQSSKITAADARRLSGVIPEEMIRVKPYIEQGWKLKAAQGYKSTSLTYSHNIRQLVDRAIEFGKFTLEIDDWVIEVKKNDPSSAPAGKERPNG